jgi:hypothetical protein
VNEACTRATVLIARDHDSFTSLYRYAVCTAQ